MGTEVVMASLASTGSVKGKVDAEASTLSVMDAEFDKLVDALLEKHHIPGMSVALVYNGKTQCKVGAPYNFRNMALHSS